MFETLIPEIKSDHLRIHLALDIKIWANNSESLIKPNEFFLVWT